MKKLLGLMLLSSVSFIAQGDAMDNIDANSSVNLSKNITLEYLDEDIKRNMDILVDGIEKYSETDKKLKLSIERLKGENEILQKKGIKEIVQFCVLNGFNDLSKNAVFIQKFLDELPRKKFQNNAENYFKTILGAVSVSFKDKLGGDQLGNRIIVTLKDGQEITYHAKTHRGGLKSQHSSSSQPVDLKELLIYKVLDFSGVGGETHFFYDDIKNFYIATKDVGYDEKNRKQGSFLTYEKIKQTTSPEELLQNPEIVNGFIKADIISRLLLLSDVINNSDNTGLSPSGQFKIIDFNPPLTSEYQNFSIFKDWLSGNNQYNYSDPTVISILKKDDKEEKIKDSRVVLKELENFEKSVSLAYDDVIKNIDKIKDIPDLQIKDLEKYTSSVIENYKNLSKNIFE